MHIKKINALLKIMPDAKFQWDFPYEYSEINWMDDRSLPTESDIDAAAVLLQTAWDAQEYARLREADYPSLQDCLHAILDDDLEALQVKRQEVKNRYPKP